MYRYQGARRPARPWFFPPGFLGLFPAPPFPRLPSRLAARQKETASETTIGGQNPSAQVLAPFEGLGFAGQKLPCFGRLLASPLRAGRRSLRWLLGWCRWCGAVRWLVVARQGSVTDRGRHTPHVLLWQVLFLSRARQVLCTLDKNPAFVRKSYKSDSKRLFFRNP